MHFFCISSFFREGIFLLQGIKQHIPGTGYSREGLYVKLVCVCLGKGGDGGVWGGDGVVNI